MDIADGVLTAIKIIMETMLIAQVLLLVICSILILITIITIGFMYINIVILIAQPVNRLQILNVILAIVHIINGRKEVFARAIAPLVTIPPQADIMGNTSYQHQQEPVGLVIQTADSVSATATHATCVETWPF